MEKSSSRAHFHKDNKGSKATLNPSKNKKQLRQSSSKQLKLLKSPHQKLPPEDGKLRQEASPLYPHRPILDNDYGVSTYYAKYKVKTSKKKQEEQYESTDYGNFRQIESDSQANPVQREPDYASIALQKLKLPTQRAVINAEGKFVSTTKKDSSQNHSLRQNSSSKHSFSLNFTREGSRSTKNKRKLLSNKSLQGKASNHSGERNIVHSYYQKRKSYSKKKKKTQIKEITKITSLNSKASNEPQPVTTFFPPDLLANDSLMQQLTIEIQAELQASKGTVRRQRLSEAQGRQRCRCVQLVGRICGALRTKRESFFLAIAYMDQYLTHFTPPTSLKIVALASLTLALKMDDAETTSRFCFHYLYNPEKTVKRNNSAQMRRHKEKEEDPKERSKLSQVLSMRISEDKRVPKEDFTLDEILEFQTQMMVRMGFRLVIRTLNYWADTFTALWDSFLAHHRPDFLRILQFRNETAKNYSYLIQLLEAQTVVGSGGLRTNLALGGLYLVARVTLQQQKQEAPWQQLCRYYRASLAKSTNLVFCDGVGINPLFGDFLSIFQLSLANIVESIQILSRHLQPDKLRVHNYSKLQGKNWEDRLATYIYNEDLYG